MSAPRSRPPTSSSSAPSTSRSSSRTTRPPGSRRSSRSTRPPSAPPSAAPASTPTPRPPTRCATSSTSRAACPTRPRSPGLDLGGGKAVIIGDPATLKTEALLRAYGRHVQSLGGRYYTACDVGTFSADMDHIARECSFVTGRTVAHGGAGDSSVLTAYGVFQGMRAAASGRLGLDLAGGPDRRRRRRRQGRHATWCGTWSRTARRSSSPTCTPPRWSAGARRVPVGAGGRLGGRAGRARRWTSTRPARSAARSPTRSSRCSQRQIVCGAANNQLAHPGVEKALEERGILYAPDYCVNAGGLIQVADELEGFSFERAQQRASGIFETTRCVFELAASDGVPPAIAADRLAEARMREVGRLRGMWVAG